MPVIINEVNSLSVYASITNSTNVCCFYFLSVSSFFLELFLHWSPVPYWAPTDLGSSSFSILSFCVFILFMGFSGQEYCSGLPFPSPVDHILSYLSTMTRPSCVAPWGCLCFIELEKAVVLVWLDCLVFCDYDFSVSALWCLLATPTILLGFLLPWAWGYVFTAAPAKHSRCSLPWTRSSLLTLNVK